MGLRTGGGGGGLGGNYTCMVNCHHQNDLCIKMGGNESHFNSSLIVTRQ